MKSPWDELFDLNNDGKLDFFEQTSKFSWLDEMEREKRKGLDDDDDDYGFKDDDDDDDLDDDDFDDDDDY